MKRLTIFQAFFLCLVISIVSTFILSMLSCGTEDITKTQPEITTELESQCIPRGSNLFHGVVTDTLVVNNIVLSNILSGVEIRVDILPFGFSYVDMTDSLGIYAIDYPCPLLPVPHQYVITATHCDLSNQQRGPIQIVSCGPIYNRFDF